MSRIDNVSQGNVFEINTDPASDKTSYVILIAVECQGVGDRCNRINEFESVQAACVAAHVRNVDELAKTHRVFLHTLDAANEVHHWIYRRDGRWVYGPERTPVTFKF